LVGFEGFQNAWKTFKTYQRPLGAIELEESKEMT